MKVTLIYERETMNKVVYTDLDGIIFGDSKLYIHKDWLRQRFTEIPKTLVLKIDDLVFES